MRFGFLESQPAAGGLPPQKGLAVRQGQVAKEAPKPLAKMGAKPKATYLDKLAAA